MRYDYTHHMVRIRANKGLTGLDKWSGFGRAGTRPQGDDRFVTAVEPWGSNGRYPPPGRWNFYSYWPEMKKGGVGKYWGNQFMPADEPMIARDQWTCTLLDAGAKLGSEELTAILLPFPSTFDRKSPGARYLWLQAVAHSEGIV